MKLKINQKKIPLKRFKTFSSTFFERSKSLLKKHVVSRKTIHKSLSYRLPARGTWAAVALTVYIIGDEYLKEGYFFSPSDMLKLGTHENLILLIWLTAATLILKNKKGDTNE